MGPNVFKILKAKNADSIDIESRGSIFQAKILSKVKGDPIPSVLTMSQESEERKRGT